MPVIIRESGFAPVRLLDLEPGRPADYLRARFLRPGELIEVTPSDL